MAGALIEIETLSKSFDGGQGFALRKQQLPRRFPFRKRPICNAVLRD